MKTKQHIFFTVFLALFLSLTGCKDELEDIEGARLIQEYNLAGRYKIQITPKMMGIFAVTSGEHDAEFIDEGDGVLRLKFTGFKKDPMPFEMSVDILMLIKPGAKGGLRVENIGGDFDADLPEGKSVIDPNDAPDGIEIPKDALTKGIHSNGGSFISGNYKMMDNPDNTQAMNFDLNLEPNVGLPVVIAIRTNRKVK